jgi:hypothetical protein
MGKKPHQEFSQIFKGRPPVKTALENERMVPVTEPDWDEIDRRLGFEPEEEPGINMTDAGAALALILQWMCGREDSKLSKPSITGAGWRAHALLYLLDPSNARYGSLQEIADAGNVSKACVSKGLVQLRAQIGGAEFMSLKISGSRETYQKAQRASIAAGVHSRYCRKDRKSDTEISLEAVAD